MYIQNGGLCILSQTLKVGQFVCWFKAQGQDICSWAGQGPLILQMPGLAFFHHLRKSTLYVKMPKCTHWVFPIAEASAQSMKAGLFFVSPLAKTLLVISFSLLTASLGVNTVLSNLWKRRHGDFWCFAGLFVLSDTGVSLKSIFLEVNSLWATTLHSWTKDKNKYDRGAGIDAGA